jgi:hypothetical protein
LASDHSLGAWQRINAIHRIPGSTGRKALLVVIAKHEARRDGVCRASEGTLAREASLSRRWVSSEITKPADENIIAANRHSGRPPMIEIKWNQIMVLAESDPTEGESKWPGN